jgi:hypothetical protein
MDTFNSLVPIDTPEAGSALADYLVANAGATLNPDAGFIASELWDSHCDASDTVQSCFYNFNMPLAPAGWPADSGAVGSLRTNYSRISDWNANPPENLGIPNSQVAAISAVYPDDGTSLLRAGLNEFVDAIQGAGSNSLPEILGDVGACTTSEDINSRCLDDVIVPLASQVAGSSVGAVPFQYLEHTYALPFLYYVEPLLNLYTLSDANVTQSTAVNQMILCFLVAGGMSTCPGGQAALGQSQASNQENATQVVAVRQSAPCKPSPQLGVPNTSANSSNSATLATRTNNSVDCSEGGKDQQQTTPRRSVRDQVKIRKANDRLDVLTSDDPLVLAEPNEISLRLHDPSLTNLVVTQVQYLGKDGHSPDFVSGSRQSLQILHHEDGSSYIAIVPMRLGKVELDLMGRFPDGGIVYKKLMVRVVPTQKLPVRLMVGHIGTPGMNSPRVLESMTGERVQEALNLYAVYEGLTEPLMIDPAFATFTTRTNEKVNPIHLDHITGSLTPLNVGQALVETSFGGRTNLTCVVVKQALDPNRSYLESNCRQLLSSGEKLGPVR